jgi:transcriptional regulator with XRE-family HTH domain
MNESLRRALLRARLTEEDVAARLEVDPKTVRRWLEGRVPYPRHRWILATTLNLEETDIWPQLGSVGARPHEVVAIYSHRDEAPRDLWIQLCESAEREISILKIHGLPFAEEDRVLPVLERRARAGVRVRICLPQLDARELAAHRLGTTKEMTSRKIETRLYRDTPNNSICRSDDELLVVQHAYGIAPGRAPVLHLRRVGPTDMAACYVESFERVWGSARPASA